MSEFSLEAETEDEGEPIVDAKVDGDAEAEVGTDPGSGADDSAASETKTTIGSLFVFDPSLSDGNFG